MITTTRIATLIAGSAIALSACTPHIALTHTPPTPSVRPSSTTTPALPPCTVEDSSLIYPCLWDASKRSNGKGRSFIMTSADSYHYITP